MKPLTNSDGVILVQNAVDNHNTLVDKLSYARDKMTQNELAYLIEHYCIDSQMCVATGEHDIYTIKIAGGTHFIGQTTPSIPNEEKQMYILPIEDKMVATSLRNQGIR